MGQVEKINNNHHDTLNTAVQKLGLELTSTKEKEGSSAARENSGGGKVNLFSVQIGAEKIGGREGGSELRQCSRDGDQC